MPAHLNLRAGIPLTAPMPFGDSTAETPYPTNSRAEKRHRPAVIEDRSASGLPGFLLSPSQDGASLNLNRVLFGVRRYAGECGRLSGTSGRPARKMTSDRWFT